jgi:arsenate reductase-like glutaredoxin family protein
MALRRATYWIFGEDEKAMEQKALLEQYGVEIDLRDLSKRPLTEREVAGVIGHLDLRHFINPTSPSYEKHNLDEKMPSREELVKLIAADNSLLRRPIIRTTRLMTIGFDKNKIGEMLQVDFNHPPVEDRDTNGTNDRQPVHHHGAIHQRRDRESVPR